MIVLLIAYVALMLFIGWVARGRVHSAEDYLVAGRRLGLPLATATLLATWFGAGTLLTASDEIYHEGLKVAALEPIGPGLCLLVAAFFFAGPLWRMKILTLSDFFRRQFGRKVEVLSVFVAVPGYMGWVAVQLVALGGVLKFLLGGDLQLWILGIAAFTTLYTLMGGMWSITLTDAVQMAILAVGIVILAVGAFSDYGNGSFLTGLVRTWQNSDPSHRNLVPHANAKEFLLWSNLLIVATLGNIPGQDLTQRMFSSRSAQIAKRACIWAGLLYLTLGALPPLVAMLSALISPGLEHSIILTLSQMYFSPAFNLFFVLVLVSAVLSTIDSAIFAPASLIANNYLKEKLGQRFDEILLCKYSIVGVALGSTLIALMGEDAYSILESAYGIGLVGLFLPLVVGIYCKVKDEKQMLIAMVVGITIWIPEMLIESDWPLSIIAVLVSSLTYFGGVAWQERRGEREAASLS